MVPLLAKISSFPIPLLLIQRQEFLAKGTLKASPHSKFFMWFKRHPPLVGLTFFKGETGMAWFIVIHCSPHLMYLLPFTKESVYGILVSFFILTLKTWRFQVLENLYGLFGGLFNGHHVCVLHGGCMCRRGMRG